ncbi:MAG: response regulator [Lachnospiraceae bacterium]|nr:response regulator [Lachnospiraceae bacterium]
MRKILFVSKMNETAKNLNTALSQYYQVQFSSPMADMVFGMLDVVGPDLVLISLIGVTDIDPVIFNRISTNYPDLPVLTIGTESEQKHFLRYYSDDQFENLIRPIENSRVINAIARRLNVDLGNPDAGDKTAAPAAPTAKKSVLIVDDNAGTLRNIKSMLDDTYEVTVATSGMKALTMIGKKRPDLILLDYEMPIVDGKQTLEMIRAESDIANIPVIFLTGVSDREHIEAVISLKPAGYMLKPPVKAKILEAIAKVIK